MHRWRRLVWARPSDEPVQPFVAPTLCVFAASAAAKEASSEAPQPSASAPLAARQPSRRDVFLPTCTDLPLGRYVIDDRYISVRVLESDALDQLFGLGGFEAECGGEVLLHLHLAEHRDRVDALRLAPC